VLVIQNRAPIQLSDIRVTPVLVNAAGQAVQSGSTIRLTQSLAAGQQIAVDAGLGALPQEQLQALRFRVDGARVAD
jgi:hypothetical protein